jgi:hypothetical protein
LGYEILLDVKKRVNVFFKNFLDRKEEATELLCLSKRMILHATLIPANSCTWCFSTHKTSRAGANPPFSLGLRDLPVKDLQFSELN